MDPQTWQQQAPAARHSHWEESGGSGISGIGVGPIFEADFRPNRRAQDAIVEIHALGTRRYHWVFEADIQACLTSLEHCPLGCGVPLKCFCVVGR